MKKTKEETIHDAAILIMKRIKDLDHPTRDLEGSIQVLGDVVAALTEVVDQWQTAGRLEGALVAVSALCKGQPMIVKLNAMNLVVAELEKEGGKKR